MIDGHNSHLVAKLRANERYQDLPVIVVTEHANLDFVLRAKELKVSSFIRKPIEKTIFIDRLVETIQLEPLASSRKPILTADEDSDVPVQGSETEQTGEVSQDFEVDATDSNDTTE